MKYSNIITISVGVILIVAQIANAVNGFLPGILFTFPLLIFIGRVGVPKFEQPVTQEFKTPPVSLFYKEARKSITQAQMIEMIGKAIPGEMYSSYPRYLPRDPFEISLNQAARDATAQRIFHMFQEYEVVD